jgi:quercetin dioxygenase-like cupin family protein
LQVTRNSRPTLPWVRRAPGAHPAWHSHPNGRTVVVRDGAWQVQRRGGPVEVIRGGGRVRFGPGEEHWHLAVPTVADREAR